MKFFTFFISGPRAPATTRRREERECSVQKESDVEYEGSSSVIIERPHQLTATYSLVMVLIYFQELKSEVSVLRKQLTQKAVASSEGDFVPPPTSSGAHSSGSRASSITSMDQVIAL